MGALHEEHKNNYNEECFPTSNLPHSSSNDSHCEEEKKSEDRSPLTNASSNNEGYQSLEKAVLQTHIPNPSQQMILLEQQQQQQQQQQQLLSPSLLQQQQVLHNLIPLHLQNSMSLNIPRSGTTHNLIPPQLDVSLPSNLLSHTNNITPLLNPPYLCVQDRPDLPAVYNGVNPYYPGLRVVNQDPPIFAVDNFLTANECDFLIYAAQDAFGPAPVVGKGSGEVSSSRTSSTCYLAREDLPGYLRKVSLLTGKPPEHCELPQVGRYLPSQQYLQHFDAFDLSNEDGRRFASNGGQRTVTVLVYLNDVSRGGATAFPSLNIQVQPRRGTALVFFPATVDGLLDKMTLHAALPAVDTKFVSQVWIRQGNYEGLPSKRLFPNTEQAALVQQALANPITNGGIISRPQNMS